MSAILIASWTPIPKFLELTGKVSQAIEQGLQRRVHCDSQEDGGPNQHSRSGLPQSSSRRCVRPNATHLPGLASGCTGRRCPVQQDGGFSRIFLAPPMPGKILLRKATFVWRLVPDMGCPVTNARRPTLNFWGPQP